MRRLASFGVTAGIALAGVSVIVAAPVATSPLRDVEVPAVQLSNETTNSTPELNLWQIITGDPTGPGLDQPVVVQPVVPDAGTWQQILDQTNPDLDVSGPSFQTDPGLRAALGSGS